MKLNILFITGKVGSGKDTIINRLIDKWNFTSFFYATHLKNVLKFAGWNEKKDLKGRKLIQKVGLAFREYDENFWINYNINEIKKFIFYKNDDILNIIIGDARHPNEIYTAANYFITECNDKIVNINAIKVIGPNRDINREMDNTTLNDISEIGLDKFDISAICPLYIIENNSTIDDLNNKIDETIVKMFDLK